MYVWDLILLLHHLVITAQTLAPMTSPAKLAVLVCGIFWLHYTGGGWRQLEHPLAKANTQGLCYLGQKAEKGELRFRERAATSF